MSALLGALFLDFLVSEVGSWPASLTRQSPRTCVLNDDVFAQRFVARARAIGLVRNPVRFAQVFDGDGKVRH
jgi:hypothetical protein